MIRRIMKAITRTKFSRPIPDLSSTGGKPMKMTKLTHWVAQRRFSRSIAWCLFSAILLTGTTYAYLTNTGIHVPPMTGPYAYNTFKPGAAGFPAVGGTYTDPVFGTVVKRLTNIGAKRNDDDIYSKHVANADGTLAFTRFVGDGGITIVAIATANPVYTTQPAGSSRTDVAWDALDPDMYYYYNGANLVRRNLKNQNDTTIKTFPAALQNNGGSLNTQSRDGRYFTVRYGGTNKVWDSQTDTIYSGSVTPLSAGGWVAITPDGNYIVNAAGPNSEAPQIKHYSYPIDHGAKSIGGTPTQFWGLCGAHGELSSASNGKNYYIGVNCYDGIPGIYRVDITLSQAGRTSQEQLAGSQLLVALEWDDDIHFSAVSRGAYSDWVFASIEAQFLDKFNGPVLGWTAYKQEIIAINVVTLEVRRLAHHRSRSTFIDYYYQPRVSSSWDGSVVMWTSNYNMGLPTGYADLYAIQFPLAGSPPPSGRPPAPQNLRLK
jgi:hypothetical protein